MKKLLSAGLAFILSICLLSSCTAKLPSGMEEETVLTAAEELVSMLNDEKYEDICGTMSSEMQEAIKGEAKDAVTGMQGIWQPVAAKLGTFEEIKKTALTGKGEFAVAIVQCKYANGSITFTLSYNKDMQLSGFFYK